MSLCKLKFVLRTRHVATLALLAAIAACCIWSTSAAEQDFLSIPPGKLGLEGYDSFLVLLSGRDAALLEQGGCNPRQTGGLEPRAQLAAQLRARGLPTLLVDLGDTFPGPGPGAAETAQVVMRAMDRMGYDALVLCGNELSAVSAATLEAMAREVKFSLLGANLERTDGAPAAWKPWIKRQLGGLSVGVIGLVPDALPLDASQPYRIRSQAETLRTLLPEVRRQVDKVMVVAADITRLRPGQFRDVDLWCSVDPRMMYQYVGPGRPLLYLANGEDFLSTFVLRYPRPPGRLIVVPKAYPLSAQKYPDAGMRALVTTLYHDLSARGLAPRPEGALEEQPQEMQRGAGYVGSASCAPCHADPYAQWKKTPHARTSITLASREREFWPECLTCHSTGYGAASGYAPASARRELAEVGCETCHGPGAAHTAAPRRDNIRNDVSPVTTEVCESCHDPKHDPSFSQDVLERFADVIHETDVQRPQKP